MLERCCEAVGRCGCRFVQCAVIVIEVECGKRTVAVRCAIAAGSGNAPTCNAVTQSCWLAASAGRRLVRTAEGRPRGAPAMALAGAARSAG